MPGKELGSNQHAPIRINVTIDLGEHTGIAVIHSNACCKHQSTKATSVSERETFMHAHTMQPYQRFEQL